MTNEQLADMVKSGNADVLELWGRVRRFAYGRAIRWAAAVGVQSGVDLDDLLQSAFIALLDAVDGWEPCGGYRFITCYSTALKASFSEACGLRTQRAQRDPLRLAMSLDAPSDPGDEDCGALAELVPDPAASEAFEDVERRDRAERLHDALAWALQQLPEAQRAAVVSKYYQDREADRAALSAAIRALRHPRLSRALRGFL